MQTWISPDNHWAIWAVMLSGVAVSIVLEHRYTWAKKLSGAVVALLLAMLLANLKIMPTAAAAYDVVWGYLVPLSIPLLLMQANVVRIARTTGRMFLGFHIAAAGTLLGAVLATVLLGRYLPEPAAIAGIMTGSYIGGSLNFFAVTANLEVGEAVTIPLLVADYFVMAVVFIILLTLAGSAAVGRLYRRRHAPDLSQADQPAPQTPPATERPAHVADLARGLAIAAAIVAVGMGMSDWLGSRLTMGFVGPVLSNPYVLITSLSVVVATLAQRHVAHIPGTQQLGTYLLYVFLFVIGLPADVVQVIQQVPMMLAFCAVIAAVNLVIALGIGRLLGVPLEDLLICINATLGGPPTAAAMAAARGWSALVLPALLVGIWGYAIGTPLGIMLFEWLSTAAG